MNIRKTMQKHWMAAIVAVLVAIVMAMPQIIFVGKLGGDYRGIPRFVDDDALHYMVRAREAADGHGTLGNPYIAEHKEKPAMQFFIPDWIEAKILTALGLDIPTGFLMLIPFFGFLNALLVYGAVYALTRSRMAAVLTSAFLLLGLFARTFNRPTNPSFTILFWFLEFYALLSFTRADKKSWKLYALNCLALGALFHIYPYFWSFYITVLGIVFMFASVVSADLASIFRREGESFFGRIATALAGIMRSVFSNPMLNLRDIFIILSGALLVAIPYFYEMASAMRLPEYSETLIRSGMLKTHFPSGIRLVVPGLAVLFASAALYWRRLLSLDRGAVFMLGGVAGSLVVINQHVITGTHIEPSLHYVDIGLIWLALTAAYLAVTAARKVPKYATAIAVSVAIIVAVTCVRTSVRLVEAYSGVSQGDLAAQRYADILQWLERNTAADDVVYADTALSLFIPAFTHDNVIYDRNSNHFFLSNAEVQDRFLLQSYFEKVDEQYISRYERSFFGVHYTDVDGQARQENKLRKLLHLPLRTMQGIPREEVDRVMARWHEIQKGVFEEELKRYRVDWMVWDTISDPHWQPIESLPFLEKVADVEGGFAVYRVK